MCCRVNVLLKVNIPVINIQLNSCGGIRLPPQSRTKCNIQIRNHDPHAYTHTLTQTHTCSLSLSLSLSHSHTHTHTHTHIHTHTHTHTRTHSTCSMLQNYAKWQLTEGFLRVLNDTFAEPYFDFRRKFKTSSQSISYRAEMCLYILQELMPLAALRLLAEDVLSENAMVFNEYSLVHINSSVNPECKLSWES